MIAGRRVAVVPFAVAAGWELSLGPRVVVVREVRLTTIVVADPAGGPPEEIDIQKEDNAENTPDDRGSPITDGDTSTPALVAEEDVDEEVDE